MIVVSPYRPFVPESVAHLRLGPFDWIEALQCSQASAREGGGATATFAITDVDTDLPVPTLHYVTRHRRLMLWILEVALRYLESDDFREDTLLLSPDVLMFKPIQPWFRADLGVVVRLRPKYVDRPVLNSVQLWQVAAKTRLVAFYQRALAHAEALPEDRLRWGGDTDPFIAFLSPLTSGVVRRAGVSVHCMEELGIMGWPTRGDVVRLDHGLPPSRPTLPFIDFKYLRKHDLARYYRATRGGAAA